METLKFDVSKKSGKFKIMHGGNGGPLTGAAINPNAYDQFRSNLESYKALKIPIERNHDVSTFYEYGGFKCVDISGIFPDFDADPYDPNSYHFFETDNYTLWTLEAGPKPMYCFGERIEHNINKYYINPPKDFQKWAVICEHIVRHYNEGWADGHHIDIEYWEIWNEPDMDPDDGKNKHCWGGTKAQYFDLYEITAKHLKKCFPNIKIGGPSLALHEDWARDFMVEMKRREAPVDFFTWHLYFNEPEKMVGMATRLKQMLIETGYEDIPNILNEWNYVRDWTDSFAYSLSVIGSMKSAAFYLASMSAGQQAPIDMAMCYMTVPSSIWNGLWDLRTWEPTKGYYAYLWYSKMYDNQAEIKCENHIPNIYTLCGCDENERVMCLLTYYSDTDGLKDKTFSVDLGKNSVYEIYLLDEDHTAQLVDETCDLTFTMKQNTCIMIKEKA